VSERARFIVKMKKITYPNGEKRTRSVILFDVNDIRAHFPEDDAINETLPKIDEEYDKLIKAFKKEGPEILPLALDIFLKNISKFAIVGGLMDVLPVDLDVSIDVVEKALINTSWFRQLIDRIGNEFRKGKKGNSIKYAESVRQLVDVFGLNYTLALLNRKDIKMKKSTARALCKVAGETPKIKELIRKGLLPLTIAFELPSIEEEQREKIAEELVSKKGYAEQRKYLKEVKMSLAKS